MARRDGALARRDGALARRDGALAQALATGWLAGLARAVITARLYAVLLTVLAWVLAAPTLPEVGVTALVGAVAGAALVRWADVARTLVRHPWLLVLDVGLALCFGVVTAPQLSFLYYLTSIAFLAGMIAGAVWLSVVAVLVTLGALAVMSPYLDGPGRVQDLQLLSLVALFPASALAMRALLRAVASRLEQARRESEAAARSGATAERGRIALDLHDSLGKTLEGVLLSVTALQGRLPGSHRAQGLAQRVEADMRAATAQARMLMLELQHDPGTGRAPAVTAYSQRWARRTGISLHLTALPGPPVDPVVSHAVLAMLTECLANVEDHSGSREASVVLERDLANGQVVLTVRDRGCGLPPGVAHGERAPSGHLGIAGLRRRAEGLGGRLLIEDSAPGTRVSITVPARPPAAGPPSTIDLTENTEVVP